MPKTTCKLLLIVAFSLIAIYAALLRNNHRRSSPSAAVGISRDSLHIRSKFLSTASNYTVAAYLRHLTLRPHLAGTPPSLSNAAYVRSHFQSLGLETHTADFSALLSYPGTTSLAAHFSNGTVLTVHLPEPGVAENDLVSPYHAYSPSGSAYAKAAFLNYGREEDYRALGGVDIKGCVGVVRRGSGMSRYEVAAIAAVNELSAVLMYTEGEYREGVERGTVMKSLGDPLTPGWAGIDGGEKLDLDDPRVTQKFPGVPSLPVSEAAAEMILKSLEGFSSGTTGITRAGPGPTMLNFTYQGEKKLASIQNVFAVIEGAEEPDRVVLLGNHRDAWTYGAVDPNSGTAVLLDIARRFSLLMSSGWRPRRTIILCSWDAEEFGMIGSTEWVEQNLMNLGSKAVAYLNVDCAAQGSGGLFISATPQLDDLLVHVTKQVKDPDSEDSYVYETWRNANQGVGIQRLSRVDSDFAPFLHHAGVLSLDLYFGTDFAVYHTAFDSYDWMIRSGDPLFRRHVAMAGIWGLVTLHLADDTILPLNYLNYAKELKEYNNVLDTLLDGAVSSTPISDAVLEFTFAAKEIEDEIKKVRMDRNADESTVLKRRALNDRLMLAERGFLDSEGIPARPWFRHLIYGPCGSHENIIDFFPGIADAIARKNEAAIRHEIWRVARAIRCSASALRGEFT